MRAFIDRFGGWLACLLLVSGLAWSQVPSGVPARLRVTSLGVGAAVPAGSGNVAINGTATVAGSAVHTRATEGRVAFGEVSSAGVLSRSLNVTSSTRTGLGTFTLDVTAAGFSAAPACVLSLGGGIAGAAPTITGRATSATSVGVVLQQYDGPTDANSGVDQIFEFVCLGP